MLDILIQYFLDRLKEPKTWKGLIALIASIIMYLLPEDANRIITVAVGAIGMTDILRVEH